MTGKLGINTVLLTDELIAKYSSDRIIKNKGNINLKKDKILEPVPGGLYDSEYFGSVLMDTCNCRTVKKVNVYCYICGSTPLDEVTRNSRFARIELPYLYLPYFKMKGLVKLIQDTFKINFDFAELDEVAGRDKLIKALELGQVEITIQEDAPRPILRLHDQYTDISLVSYEGLLSEMNKIGLTEEALDMKRYLDKFVLVSPASMRGIKITTVGGQRQLAIPYTTSVYTSIMMVLDQLKEKSDNRGMKEEIIMRGVVRNYLRKSLGELSEFTKSSKDNLARQMYSARVPNTFRSVITAGPDLKTDEISIPFQNAYAMMKDEFIEKLMKDQGIPYFRANEIYTKGDTNTLNDFENYFKERNPVFIMVRQPALYKYSMMGFRGKLHKGHDLKLPLEICGPFGGDFDGDTMSTFLVPEEFQEDIISKMSPIALKYFDKNMKPIIEPSHGVVHGYIQCSKVDYKDSKVKPKVFDTLEEIEDKYNKNELELQELVYLAGVPTTYGRATIEKYLGTTISKALGSDRPLEEINNNNITDLMRYVAVQKNAAEITKDIRVFVLEMSTLEGFTSLSLDQLYTGIPNDYLNRLDAVRNDSSMEGVAKFVRLHAIQKEIGDWIKDNMDQDMKETMENSNRMKISALLEMTMPQMTLTDDSRLLANEGSLYTGLSEEEYRTHGLQNRSILDLKQKLVPRSGYLNRQLYYMGQGLEYRKELDDTKNTGILLPKHRAEGRTTIDGKIVRKSTSTDLVRVRSVAVTEKRYVCPDHLSIVSFPPSETTQAFGLRVMTSLTEQFTQAGLSLKHSGSFVEVPQQNRLITHVDAVGTAKKGDDDKTLIVVNDLGKVLSTYPLPNKFDILYPEVKGKKSHIGTTLATSSAGLNLDIMIKIMGSRSAMIDEGLAKNVIHLSPSYAPVSGIIDYNFTTGTFRIGSNDMGPILPHAVYYYPQGAKIDKYTKISSDPISPAWYLKNGYPLEDVYQIFRLEFRNLAGNLTEELLEVLFHSLIHKDPKTGENEYLGSYRSMTKGSTSFFAQLSFERGKSAISKLAAGELKFEDDMFTRNILDFMIMSAKTEDIKKKK